MPIEQVKLNAKKLKCPVPATLKVQRGRIGLYRGKFARVEIWTSKGKKPLCVCRNVGGKTVREFFGLDEITYANDKARHYETQGKANGERFGTISNDEKAALMKWRNYVWQSLQAGKEPRSLAEIIGELIEREEHKDETPFFEAVALKFLEYKDAGGGVSLEYRNRIKNRLNALSKVFKGVRMAEITEARLFDAITKISQPRAGTAPAEKTRKHWISTTKEIFEWFYKRENATRRAADKLTNPLEIVELPKISKEKEPEILTVEQTRTILADLWEHERGILPAVIVQIFCGVRNSEALRLRWRDIVEGEIRLSCSITKTKISRTVPVPAAAQAWFDALKIECAEMNPDELLFKSEETSAAELAAMTKEARARVELAEFHSRQKRHCDVMLRVERRTGIQKPANAFRHTAVSCLAKLHGFTQAADWCGHNVRTQGVFYRTAVSQTEAKDYFGIMPPNEGKPAIVFSREQARKATREHDAGSAGTDESESRDGQGESVAL